MRGAGEWGIERKTRTGAQGHGEEGRPRMGDTGAQGKKKEKRRMKKRKTVCHNAFDWHR